MKTPIDDLRRGLKETADRLLSVITATEIQRARMHAQGKECWLDKTLPRKNGHAKRNGNGKDLGER